MKKILSFCMVLVLLLTVLSVGASGADVPFEEGAVLYVQNFESEVNSYLVGDGGNYVGTKITENDNTYIDLSVNARFKTGNISVPGGIPENFAVMVDICQVSDAAKSFGIQIYTTERHPVNWGFSANTLDQGVWYTYLTVRTDGALKVYRKEKGTAEPFREAIYHGVTSISGVTSGTFSTEIYLNGGEDVGAEFSTTRYYLDNIMLFTKTFADTDTVKLSVDDAEGGKKVKASVNIVSSIDEGNRGVVYPVMIVFDKKGKATKMSALTESAVFSYGNENPVSVELILSDSEYQKVRGGTAEFYLWESPLSFKPVMDDYSITIQ